MPLSPDQIVNGKYRVIRLLGDGGMGSVYEAHHEVLNTRVALKLLHPELSRTGTAKRFLQEAQASARINSPHVVRVADADRTPDGQAFIVLEYLEGKTLRELYEQLAREGGALPATTALDYAMQMFEGVEAAHAAGIVHRDLKPDNVMITSDSKGAPLLKLLDFGIAKVDEPAPSSPALTRPGSFLGTPEYMAPEQVYSAGTADARSDIFSLGVMLFEMLAGRRPVAEDDPQQLAVSYLTGAFTRLEVACPGVPADLAAAVHRALAPLPRDRFASVAEMRAAIEPFAPPRSSAPSRASTGRASSLLPVPGAAGMMPSSALENRPSRLIPETRPGTQLADVASAPRSPAFAHQGVRPPTSAAQPRSMSVSGRPPVAGGTELIQVAGQQPVPSSGSVPPGPWSGVPGTPGTQALAMSPADAPRSIAMDKTAPAIHPPSYGPPPSPSQEFVPEYPPPDLASHGYPSAPGAPAVPPPWAGGWPPQVPVVPPTTPTPGSRKGLYIGLVILVVVLATAITLAVLYVQGWFDPDPPPRPHKTAPAKPTPKPPAKK